MPLRLGVRDAALQELPRPPVVALQAGQGAQPQPDHAARRCRRPAGPPRDRGRGRRAALRARQVPLLAAPAGTEPARPPRRCRGGPACGRASGSPPAARVLGRSDHPTRASCAWSCSTIASRARSPASRAIVRLSSRSRPCRASSPPPADTGAPPGRGPRRARRCAPAPAGAPARAQRQTSSGWARSRQASATSTTRRRVTSDSRSSPHATGRPQVAGLLLQPGPPGALRRGARAARSRPRAPRSTPGAGLRTATVSPAARAGPPAYRRIVSSSR